MLLEALFAQRPARRRRLLPSRTFGSGAVLANTRFHIGNELRPTSFVLHKKKIIISRQKKILNCVIDAMVCKRNDKNQQKQNHKRAKKTDACEQ